MDPTIWTRHVNDQAIVIGWAGYDDKVQYLPPEHFLALEFRTALWEACQGGELSRCGPDGKLIVRLREDRDGFALEHVLVTLEHPQAMSVFELARAGECGARAALRKAAQRGQAMDRDVARGGVAGEPERSAVGCGQSQGQRPDRPQAGDGLLRSAGAAQEAGRSTARIRCTWIGSGRGRRGRWRSMP